MIARNMRLSAEELCTYEARMQRVLDQAIAGRRESLQILGEQGAFAHATIGHNAICTTSLELGQFAYVVKQNIDAAKAYFAFPSSSAASPGFLETCRMVQTAMTGKSSWNGERMSMVGQLEGIVCSLLLGRVNDVAEEYAMCDDADLFVASDKIFARVIFSKQLVYGVQGKCDSILEADYAKCRDLKPSLFLYGYHRMLLSIARGDSAAFQTELADCCAAFQKRGSARQDHYVWGYKEAAQWSFDVLGTALCRLATQRGIDVAAPDATVYPSAFWR